MSYLPQDASFTRSIRLGNSTGGSEAEGLYYTFQVTPQNALIFINYAVVFHNALHLSSDNQEFIIRIKRQNSSGVFSNISDSLFYVLRAPVAGNQGSWIAEGDIVYQPWSQMTIDLSNYLYETIRIEVYVSDCSFGTHYGYCYIAAECQPMVLNFDGCITIEAPRGLNDYQWYCVQHPI